MFTDSKHFFFVAVLLIVASSCWSETVYLTFPVKGPGKLLKEDLTLRISEKDVAITEFLLVDTASRDYNILVHPAGRRQYFIVVDLLHLNAGQALELRKMIQDFVSRVPKEDLIALAAITHEDGLRFFSGLSADRSKLIAGWNAMGRVVVSGMVEGPEGNLYTSKFSSETPASQLLPDQEFTANLKTYALSDKSKPQFAPLYVQAFVDLASLFSTVNGRKHLILFSPGADVSGLEVNLQKPSPEDQAGKAPTPGDDHQTLDELTEPQLRDRASMDATLSKSTMRKNDVDVIWKLIEGTGGQVHVFRPADQENNFLKDLVQKTRGIYRKIPEFPSAAEQILAGDKAFYVVGWQQGERQEGFYEVQPIELKASPGAVEAPSRWLAPKALADYTVLEKKIRLSQAMYKNLGTADSYRFWSDIIFDDGFNRVSCFTQIPGESVLKHKSSKLELVFYGFVVEESGSLLDFSTTTISLDLTNEKLIERLRKGGLRIWNVLFAAQKPVNVRTIVWNNLTGETFTHSSMLDFDRSQFFLTNPFFPTSNFDWIFWPAPDQPQTRRGIEILYPYQIGPDIFIPELQPRLQPAEKGKVIYFKMYNFTPGEKYPAVKLRIVGDNGNSMEIQRFGLLQQPRLIQGGGLEVFWTIESLPELAAGTYRFQVDVTDPSQGKSVIRDVLTAVE